MVSNRILILSEQNVADVGGLNMDKCIECLNKVFRIQAEGDYVMGGKNHNSHGTMMTFPQKTSFPNMPSDGPDRRFMSMISYVGGEYNVSGSKWYGSNRNNLAKGLPRSVHTIVLNDPDTCFPKAVINGTSISVMRTGAVPGLAAKYLARPESEVLAMIGCGPIGRSALAGIFCTCTNIKIVKMYSVHRESTEANRRLLQEKYPEVSFILANSIEAAVRDSDVISFATSGAQFPYVNEEWLKPGVFCSIPSDIDMDESFITGAARNVIDNWNMYEAWSEELPEPYIENMPLIGTYMYKYVTEGKMNREKITELKDIVTGKAPGRLSVHEKIILGMGGQCIYDVAWAEEIYRSAVNAGIGTVLDF